MQDFSKFVRTENVDEDAAQVSRAVMVDRFRARCVEICTDARQLCDILLDVCYRREGSRQLVWDICSHEIVENLLARNGGVLSYPEMDSEGDIEFGGRHFSMKTIGGFGDEQYNSEREGVCTAGDGEQEPGEQPSANADARCETASC